MRQRRVSGEERTEFAARGHVLLPGIFSPRRVEQLAAAVILTAQTYTPLDSGPRDLWKRSAEIKRLIFEEGLGEIAADLLGVDRIRLIHDALFQKTGSQRVTPWHRDTDYWAFEGVGALTMWIPLQDTSPDLALGYISGSHLDGRRRFPRLLEKSVFPRHRAVSRGAVAMGDIAVHHCHTLHASSKYRGMRTRRALAVHVIDANARLAVPRTHFQKLHNRLSNWIVVQPGDELPDEIAPMLFERDAAAAPSSDSFLNPVASFVSRRAREWDEKAASGPS